MGNPAWTSDERFASSYSRWQNQEQLDRHIQEWTISHSHLEVMKKLQAAGVAAMPSFSAEELFSDPHMQERKAFTEINHSVMGKQMVMSPPFKLSETPATIKKAGPLLGEHNEYVFGELLGMPKQMITQLKEEKVIY